MRYFFGSVNSRHGEKDFEHKFVFRLKRGDPDTKVRNIAREFYGRGEKSKLVEDGWEFEFGAIVVTPGTATELTSAEYDVLKRFLTPM